jgi:hypothetical protein
MRFAGIDFVAETLAGVMHRSKRFVFVAANNG